MTREETKKMLAVISVNYGEKLFYVTPEKVNLWAQLLSDLEYMEVQGAIKNWIMTEKFPPTVADIRGAIADKVLRGIPAADEAWGILMNNVREYGPYKKRQGIEALPEDIRDIVERWGYNYYCMFDESQSATVYAQFRDAYNATIRRKKRNAQLPVIEPAPEVKQIEKGCYGPSLEQMKAELRFVRDIASDPVLSQTAALPQWVGECGEIKNEQKI